jgi:hypothetical protein
MRLRVLVVLVTVCSAAALAILRAAGNVTARGVISFSTNLHAWRRIAVQHGERRVPCGGSFLPAEWGGLILRKHKRSKPVAMLQKVRMFDAAEAERLVNVTKHVQIADIYLIA